MRNFDYLREMRRRGFAPMKVYIDLDFDVQYGRLVPFNPELPHLYVGPEENVRTLDLRCLTGLDVQVNGFDIGRLAAIEAAISRVDPTRIITVLHNIVGEGEFKTFPIISVTDTKGIVTWQED